MTDKDKGSIKSDPSERRPPSISLKMNKNVSRKVVKETFESTTTVEFSSSGNGRDKSKKRTTETEEKCTKKESKTVKEG